MDHPQFRYTFDTYHQQRGAGALLRTREGAFDVISGVQVGDAPTRQEPGTGEINFPGIARKLRELGFDGFIGLEFSPSTTEEAALERVRAIFDW